MNKAQFKLSDDVLIADGYDEALIGVGTQFSNQVAVYDYGKCVDVAMGMGLTREEAEEYLEFNFCGAYLGSNTPVVIRRYVKSKIEDK